MGLITKKVEIIIHNKNINYYEEKGYIIPKYKYQGHLRVKRGTKIIVKINDLSKGSHIKIKAKCDNCGKEMELIWKNYINYKHENNKCYCKKCGNKLFGVEKRKNKQLLNGQSFYDWCYENLNEKEADEIINKWDYELNQCSPKEVCYSSHKKYYFKCPREIHESEKHSIHILTIQHRFTELHCRKCNSFAEYLIDNYGENALDKYWSDKNTLDPWRITLNCKKRVWIKCQEKDYHSDYLIACHNFSNDKHRCPYCSNQKIHPLDSLGQYIINNYGEDFLNKIWSSKNKKSIFEYAPHSNKEVWFKCPDGKHKDFKRNVSNSVIYKFRCPECNFSKGEDKISNYLIKNKINYISQKEFDGLLGLGNGNLSYDFYLPKPNILIEYQGEQHEKYIPGLHKSKKDFEKQVEHDRRKRKYAEQHNIKLLEIWYWDFNNIEEIVNKELKINIY